MLLLIASNLIIIIFIIAVMSIAVGVADMTCRLRFRIRNTTSTLHSLSRPDRLRLHL